MYLSVSRIHVQPGRDGSQVSATASRSERFSRMPQQMIQQRHILALDTVKQMLADTVKQMQEWSK